MASLKKYEKKAKAGDAEYQVKLGLCYYNGVGTERNIGEAMNWFRLAAEQGNANGFYNLGRCYGYSSGGDAVKRQAKAIENYRKAESLGCIDAAYASIQCYLKSNPKEADVAKYLYERGELFVNGNAEVTRNTEIAMIYFGEAVALGHKEASKAFDKVIIDARQKGKKKANIKKGKESKAKQPNSADEKIKVVAREYFEQKKYKKAYKKFLVLAKRGDAEAQGRVGRILYNGLGIKTNEKKARLWLEKAVAGGDIDGHFWLGKCYANGVGGVLRDDEKAFELYTVAATENIYAQYWLAMSYYKGVGTAPSFKNAVQWFEKSAEGGNPFSMEQLGDMYRTGEYVKKDAILALSWYEKAAKLGNMDAKKKADAIRSAPINAAKREEAKKLFRAGKYVEAFPLCKEYRSSSEPELDYMTGYCYEYGYGVAQSDNMAKLYYQWGAENGDVNAQSKYASFFYSGKGGDKSLYQAFTWFTKAANNGNLSAMKSLADMHLNGEGTDKDISKAKQWYQKAAEGGSQEAKVALDILCPPPKPAPAPATTATVKPTPAAAPKPAPTATSSAPSKPAPAPNAAPSPAASTDTPADSYASKPFNLTQALTNYKDDFKAYDNETEKQQKSLRENLDVVLTVDDSKDIAENYRILAYLFQYGRGCNVNKFLAVKCYERALKLGSYPSYCDLEFVADQYYEGKVVERNLEKAYDYYERFEKHAKYRKSKFTKGYAFNRGEKFFRDKLFNASKIVLQFITICDLTSKSPNTLWFATRIHDSLSYLKNLLNLPEKEFDRSWGFNTAEEKELLENVDKLTTAMGRISNCIARLIGVGGSEADTYINWATGEFAPGRWLPHCIDPELKELFAAMKPHFQKVEELQTSIYPLYKEKLMYYVAQRDKIKNEVKVMFSQARDEINADYAYVNAERIIESVKEELRDVYPKYAKNIK